MPNTFSISNLSKNKETPGEKAARLLKAREYAQKKGD
jgi:hypothetical protein